MRTYYIITIKDSTIGGGFRKHHPSPIVLDDELRPVARVTCIRGSCGLMSWSRSLLTFRLDSGQIPGDSTSFGSGLNVRC